MHRAAAGELACADAGVVIQIIAVVTNFVTFIERRQVLPSDAIAAARWLARVGAGISRILVTVITNLTGVDAPVTADLNSALSVAAIANL